MSADYLDDKYSEKSMADKSDVAIICRELGATSEPFEDIPSDYNHAKLLVIDGKLQFTIGGECYTMQRGDFADIIRCPMKLAESSMDVRAYLLLLTDNHIQNLFGKYLPFSFQYVMCKLSTPIYHLRKSDFNIVLRNMENIHMATICRDNRFADEILKYKILIFFLEIANILDRNSGEVGESDRQKRLFKKFIKKLEADIHHEHTVNYYANCLNVTPQYLRRVIKNVSGKNAYNLISDFLVREICNLLKETDYTLQEIAEELHFSDQTVLSRFFKRNKGMSPLKYRNDQY